jgi:hypothetical protein
MTNGSIPSRVREKQPEDAVVAWRRDQLVASGFPYLLAIRVAGDAGYDLHELLELAQSGCPPELAVRILAPADAKEAA